MSEHPRRRRRISNRDRIRALEEIPEFPPLERGRMPWRRADGTFAEYEGPLRDLGQGIPRKRSSRPFVYRVQRACWHLALGYASGYPVRDVLAFTVRGFWRIPLPTDPVLDAIVEVEFDDVDTPPNLIPNPASVVDSHYWLEIDGQRVTGGEPSFPVLDRDLLDENLAAGGLHPHRGHDIGRIPWVEPEPGGCEAYIPLAPHHRRRSAGILAETAATLEITEVDGVRTSPACRTERHAECPRRAFDPIAERPIWCACTCHEPPAGAAA